jgi:hypothetical protein
MSKKLSTNTCDICYTKFTTNYLLTKHKNKKESCVYEREELVNDEISEIKNIIKEKDKCINSKDRKCIYCKNIYSTKGTLKNHVLTICKFRKNLITELDRYNNEIIKLNQIKLNLDNKDNLKNQDNEDNKDLEIDDNYEDDETFNKTTNNLDRNTLLKMLYILTKKENHPLQTIQTQNNVNNQQIIENQNNSYTNNIQINQINLNNYDNPNCDFLTIEQKNKFLKDRYKGLIDFITYVYFNESYPENHTILYTNLRSKFGHIYKNNKWFIEEIDMIADKLNDYSFDKLSEHLDTIKDNKDETINYEKDIEKGEKFIEHYTTNDVTKQTRTNIKKIIYNNKDLVTNTKELKSKK